ncbi:acyltransferase [Polynucleobacter paneuropaeus]|nr:acyltransferase [Polynucleobacter paneuropaeus]
MGIRGLVQSQSIDAIIWTLEIEIGFYILMGLTIKSVSKASLAAFIIPVLFLMLTIFFAIIGNHVQDPRPYHYVRKLINFSPFFIFMYIGVALNFYYRKQFNSTQVLVISTALLLAALISNLATTENWHEIGPSYLLGLILFLVFMFTPAFQNWSPKVAQFFSMISYPLYVIHAVIGYILLYFLVAVAQLSPLFALMATFVVVIATALLIHYWVEIPSQRLGKSLAMRWAIK